MKKLILALFMVVSIAGFTTSANATALQIDFFLSAILDVSGDPLSGAIVVTKNAAASSAKAVWEDRAQTLPSGLGKSQFNLDSEGRAEVFGDGIYTVIIYDSADTGLTSPLYTFEGVDYESGQNSLDALASATVGSGSDLVAHTGTADTVTETLDSLDAFYSVSLDTDITMVADSDSVIASQKATKAYVDNAFKGGALVYNSTDLTLTSPSWDSEVYDTDSIHDTSVNPSRLTVPSGVTKVKVSSMMSIGSGAVVGAVHAATNKNASLNYSGNGITSVYTNNTTVILQTATAIIEVVAGDYFEMDGSAALVVSGGANGSWFLMEIIERTP